MSRGTIGFVAICAALLACLLGWWFVGGKGDPPTIPRPGDVAEIAVLHKDGGELVVIRDPGVIRSFVEQVKSLDYLGNYYERCYTDFVMKNDAGDVVLEIGFKGRRGVILKDEAGIKYAMSYKRVPLLGKLYSCMQARLSISTLDLYSHMGEWTAKERGMMRRDVEYLNITMPAARMALPENPQELARELEKLPRPDPERLDDFVDYFETWH